MNRIALMMLLLALPLAGAAWAQDMPKLDDDGTIHANDVTLELSRFLSPEARKALTSQYHQDQINPAPDYVMEGAAKRRAYSVAFHKPNNDKWRAIFPVDITQQKLGGVAVDVIIPKTGIAPENKDRVLINLHGGGFFTGAVHIGQNNSIPVAGIGRIKVITVDYRMAPEFTFPAGSEDVAAVYAELLKSYRPENIGLYGCSAGGALAGEAVAWFQTHNLPKPGAVGVFCAGLQPGLFAGGDSANLAWLTNARPRPQPAGMRPKDAPRGYFDGVDPTDPMAFPAISQSVLAQFPPTLLVSGTRDFALSSVITTHLKLLEAGATAELLIAEGLGHEQYVLPGTPESIRINTQIWRFFDRHLGK